MKNRLIIVVITFMLPFIHQLSYGIEIQGGKLIDVIVVNATNTDSTFATHLYGGWEPGGPDALDIDKDGNIYVLDSEAPKVLKFDKSGKWVPTFRLQMKKIGTLPDDIVVDNQGDVYVEKARRILKFSPEGKFLFRSKQLKKDGKDTSTVDRKHFSSWERWQLEGDEAANSRTVGPDLWVDKSGRIYTTGVRDVIYIRDSNLAIEDTIDIDREDYEMWDKNMTQKGVGDDMYFRWKQYLLRTSLEEYSQNRKVDTVATLPQELIQYRTFHGEYLIATRQAPMVVDYYLLGYDKYDYFYFYRSEWCYDKKDEPTDLCERCVIYRYRLTKGKLAKEKEVLIKVLRNEEECSKRALPNFPYRQFVLSGDGAIYWLHGTVDTVKVSKIIFDEPKSKP